MAWCSPPGAPPSGLAALPVATLQQYLADALAAYHALQTGQQAQVFVDSNGERIQYTAANRQDLYAYILALQAALTPQTGPCGGPVRPGPMGFFF